MAARQNEPMRQRGVSLIEIIMVMSFGMILMVGSIMLYMEASGNAKRADGKRGTPGRPSITVASGAIGEAVDGDNIYVRLYDENNGGSYVATFD